MKLSDVRISTRLRLSFSVLTLLIVLFGAFTIIQVSFSKAQVASVLGSRYGSLQAISRFKDAFNENLRAQRDILLLSDADDIQAALKTLVQRQNTEAQELKAIQDSMQSAQTASLMEALESARKKFVPARDHFVAKATINQELAKIVLYNELLPVQKPYSDAIDALVQFEEQAMAQEKDAALSGMSRLLASAWGMGALAVLVALVATVAITRSITGPLTQALDIAKAVSGGDLTINIPPQGRSETGVLINALRDMQSSLVTVVANVRHGSENVATASAEIEASIRPELLDTLTASQLALVRLSLNEHWHKAVNHTEASIVGEGCVWSQRHGKLIELNFPAEVSEASGRP